MIYNMMRGSKVPRLFRTFDPDIIIIIKVNNRNGENYGTEKYKRIWR